MPAVAHLSRLRSAFAEAGYRSLSADASASALRLLRDDLCDLAVLNFDLENNGGPALCKLLRSQPATSRIPIIALAALQITDQRAIAESALVCPIV